jgi:hypothetical protein
MLESELQKQTQTAGSWRRAALCLFRYRPSPPVCPGCATQVLLDTEGIDAYDQVCVCVTHAGWPTTRQHCRRLLAAGIC